MEDRAVEADPMPTRLVASGMATFSEAEVRLLKSCHCHLRAVRHTCQLTGARAVCDDQIKHVQHM